MHTFGIEYKGIQLTVIGEYTEANFEENYKHYFETHKVSIATDWMCQDITEIMDHDQIEKIDEYIIENYFE